MIVRKRDSSSSSSSSSRTMIMEGEIQIEREIERDEIDMTNYQVSLTFNYFHTLTIN